MADNDKVSSLLAAAYEKLRSVDLKAATEILERALSVDYEHPEVLYALKCANFWADRYERLSILKNPYERGEFILMQWKSFNSFQAKLGGDFDPARYAFKRYSFSLALENFKAISLEEKDTHEGDLSLRLGRCLKGAGDFDSAVKELMQAAKERREDPETLAELADALALINEIRDSKALFREAFYLGAQRVDLDSLESEMIRRLVEKVTALGYPAPEIPEWIPVYGNLWGIFTVKRELKEIEAGKLRQSIYQLENEVKEGGGERSLLVPRLINRYFWLIDHAIAAKEDRARIEEILLKIRLLDASIYKQYTA